MGSKVGGTHPRSSIALQGWQTLSVGNLVELRNGSAFNDKDWKDHGLPIIRIQNLNGSREFNHFDGNPNVHILVEPGDLLFSWSGNRGTSFGPFIWNGPEGVLNQHIFKVEPRGDIEKSFLFQALRFLTGKIEERAHGGTGIVHIRKSELEKFCVQVPPKNERRTITHILTTLDETIKYARAVIDQTRRVKTALLHDLFSHGLPGRHRSFQHVAGLGHIPRDWKVARLDEIAEVERGKFTHRPRNDPRFYGGDVPFVQTGDVVNSGDYLRGHSQTLNEQGLAISRMFPAGTILFVIAGTVGAVTIASYDTAAPDSIVGITPQKGVKSLFLLRALQHAKARIVRAATESAQANISLELLQPLLFAIPSPEEQESIMTALRNLEERIETDTQYLENLMSVKASLSQGLLTGRIPVKGRM